MNTPATSTPGRKQPQALQDPYLCRLRDARIAVTLYLVNGIKLTGTIVAFAPHALLLSGAMGKQDVFVYKHAISTLVPARAVT